MDEREECEGFQGPFSARQIVWWEIYRQRLDQGINPESAKSNADTALSAFDAAFRPDKGRPVTQADLDAIADAANAGGGFDAGAVEEFTGRSTVSDFAFVDGAGKIDVDTGTVQAEPVLSARQHVWLEGFKAGFRSPSAFVASLGSTPQTVMADAVARARKCADQFVVAFDEAFPASIGFDLSGMEIPTLTSYRVAEQDVGTESSDGNVLRVTVTADGIPVKVGCRVFYPYGHGQVLEGTVASDLTVDVAGMGEAHVKSCYSTELGAEVAAARMVVELDERKRSRKLEVPKALCHEMLEHAKTRTLPAYIRQWFDVPDGTVLNRWHPDGDHYRVFVHHPSFKRVPEGGEYPWAVRRNA